MELFATTACLSRSVPIDPGRIAIRSIITKAFCWLLRNNEIAEQAFLGRLSFRLEAAGRAEHPFVDEEVACRRGGGHSSHLEPLVTRRRCVGQFVSL